MVDHFTEVTRTSYGQRVGRSFGGVIIGLLLFAASFVLLYWNEGRVDISNIAKTATEIKAETVNTDSSLESQLVSTSGNLTITDTLGDEYLKPGDYVVLKRTVEMYAWVEEKEEDTQTKVGGSEETVTTYQYDKEWTDDPADSSDFRYPNDHNNPVKTIEDKTQYVTTAKVGVYEITPEKATMPSLTTLSLNDDNVILNQAIDQENNIWSNLYQLQPQTNLVSNYIYIGVGNLQSPQVGDLRISYSALKPGIAVTAFGKLTGSTITTYVDQDNNKLYRIYQGTRDEAIATMHSEHVTMTWILRIIGFLMMWIGLSAFLGPISTLLDVLPFLGKLSRSIISIVTFIAALALSVLTILISIAVHNLIVLLVILGVIVLLVVIVITKRKKATPGVTPSGPSTT